jgi:hypothetical protein
VDRIGEDHPEKIDRVSPRVRLAPGGADQKSN